MERQILNYMCIKYNVLTKTDDILNKASFLILFYTFVRQRNNSSFHVFENWKQVFTLAGN